MLPMILGMFLMMPTGAPSGPDRSFRVLVNKCRAAARFADAGFQYTAVSQPIEAAYCWGYLRAAVNFLDPARGLVCMRTRSRPRNWAGSL